MRLSNLLKAIEAGKPINKEDVILMLKCNDEQHALFAAATRIRKKHIGDRVYLRGIIEFSNHCQQHCHYCGLRADNQKVKRYRLNKAIIIKTAQEAIQAGYGTLVLQSGEDTAFEKESIAEITAAIKHMGAAVTLSCGEQKKEVYQLWREAGADRYLMKQESSHANLYAQLHPGKTRDERLMAHRTLKSLGYQVGSGAMVGLPGQSIDILADDLLLMQKEDIDMAGIGPFIPHPDTPLKNNLQGDIWLTCRAISVARLLMPKAMLPATTALATLHPRGRQLALSAGADVIMPNVTPFDLRVHYNIYPKKVSFAQSIKDSYTENERLIAACGRYVEHGPGHSPKLQFQHLS